MVVGKSLFIGDSDINFVTVRRAADRLGLPRLLRATLLELDDLPIARGVLERRESDGGTQADAARASLLAAASAAEADEATDQERHVRPRRSWSSMDDCRPMIVCSLGDLLLDVVVRLDTPLNLGADATAQTEQVRAGRLHVAAWATELGDRAASPPSARPTRRELVAQELQGHGVEGVRARGGGQNSVVCPSSRRAVSAR